MFTGLIIELGEVAALEKRGLNARLSVRGKKIFSDAAIGDSIAVNGICLTITSFDAGSAWFDVSGETLKSTNLGRLSPGAKVNLEPSLTPGSKMGGHFVTGHVETSGTIRSRRMEGSAEKIEIEAPQSVLRYMVPKGSVAVDGISLTVVDVMPDAFTLVIIPHTASMTTIGLKKAGDTVNLEPDILAKYVERLLQKDTATKDAAAADERFVSKLRDSGFI